MYSARDFRCERAYNSDSSEVFGCAAAAQRPNAVHSFAIDLGALRRGDDPSEDFDGISSRSRRMSRLLCEARRT